MKIKCEVTAVETTGDGLKISLQGKPPLAAEWRPDEYQQITVPINDAHAMTFYVGRKVIITVKPK
jgi:hypothetical protein